MDYGGASDWLSALLRTRTTLDFVLPPRSAQATLSFLHRPLHPQVGISYLHDVTSQVWGTGAGHHQADDQSGSSPVSLARSQCWVDH